MHLEIGRVKLPGPILIPSISSFETKISGKNALQLQYAMREPITLVSAYDVFYDTDLNSSISDYRSDGNGLFMDSGGYEFSRVRNAIGGKIEGADSIWGFDKFKSVAERDTYDLIASYDLFPIEGQTYTEYQDNVISFLQDHSFIRKDKLVPVVHISGLGSEHVLSQDHTIELLNQISANFSPPFIAIPERELGLGIKEKYDFCKIICQALSKTGNTKLHVLGCGNPLTFSILAYAGISMADGLEWCRTYYGDKSHLFHFQQYDLIKPPQTTNSSLVLNLLLESSNRSPLTALAENLHSQQQFVNEVHLFLERNALMEFIQDNFPVMDSISEIFK